MEVKKFTKVYILSDILSAATAWVLFYLFRKVFIESKVFGFPVPLHLGMKLLIGVAGIMIFWFVLYYSTGYYNNVLRKLRLEDFSKTFVASFFGICIIFFFFILDDYIKTYKMYYESFLVLFVLHLNLTLIPRLIITSYILKQEKKGKIKFNTVFIGHVEKIKQVWKDLNNKYPGHGHQILGFIPVTENFNDLSGLDMEKLGNFNEIHEIVKEKQPEDVIIVLNEKDNEIYHRIIYELNSSNVVVKVNPDLYPVVEGKAVISTLFKYPLIEISRDLLHPWQASLKQLIDIAGALFGLIVTLPISLFLIVAIKITSKGPVFYSHERVGKYGKPFHIIKFRSMYNGAEPNGPQLSSISDSRVTPIGRFMRRLKLDEIPNFYNVLKGEMSLVGPRPERRYFIDQIVKRAPEYTRLLKIKPGVTSWGQVKYGYAENVDEMIRRMRYDLLYIDNMSLYVDFQILARTIITIFRGNGK
jgi:exopolysaccharide biosynthesis polyprenyl glycosylphosphotransferase